MKKATRVKAIRQRKIKCRTFAGYIGLVEGRPDVDRWPSPVDHRVVHVFLNERVAKRAYEDVQMVTVTGPWVELKPRRRLRHRSEGNE